MSRLVLENISKRYDKTIVIDRFDLSVADGEFVVIVGPSGCGKSTLLRIVAGLADQSTGRVILGDRDVSLLPPAKRGVAMVFQSYALFPHLSVRGNMELGLRQARTDKKVVAERVAEAARILELGPLLDRKPAQLSGGQRQRVAIGRAIVRQPDVFLFDEPLSNLDAALRSQVRIEIADLHKRIGATMIYVTHDQTEAMTLADRIVVMHAGVVQQVGTPVELFRAPANVFVAGFIGSPKMNMLRGCAADGRVEIDGAGALPIKTRTVGDVIVGIRPNDIEINDDPSQGLTAKVIANEFLGTESNIRLRLRNDETVIAQTGPEHPWTVDQTVGLTARGSALLFTPVTGRRVED
jgi:multiple sugar transport system ATP-binding protein